MIALDTGNFIARRNSSYGYDTPITLQALEKMRYDALGIGDKEISWGLDELEEVLKEHDLHAVSNNVLDAETGKPRFETVRMVKLPHMKVGVTSTIGGSAVIPSTLLEREKIQIADMIGASREALKKMNKEKADLTVLIAHTGLEKAEELVDSLPGYDVILIGHDGRSFEEPKKEKGVILAATKTRSSWLGEVTLMVEDGMVQNFTGRSYELKEDDGPVDSLLKVVTYDKLELDENGNRISAKPSTPKESGDQSAAPAEPKEIPTSYIGGDKCALCHKDVQAFWAGTAHANAFKTIAESDDWENPECWKCHTVGLGEKSGHPKTALEPNLWNVQCESCHGMGSEHVRGAQRRPVGKEVCLGCHTKEWSPDFNYEKALKQVTCASVHTRAAG